LSAPDTRKGESEGRAGSERLSTRLLLAYGCLGFPLAALNLPLYVYLPPFYASTLGVGLGTVGLVLFGARLLDAITDTIVGELSDRFQTLIGRRGPWILAATPLLLIATFALFMPPEGAGWIHLAVWSSLAYVAWTMMILPYTAWGAEISTDYDQRSRITSVREGFVILGILFAAALPAMIGSTGGDRATLAAMGWTMLVVLPLCLLLLFGFVRETGRRPEPKIRFRDGLAIVAANRPFRRLIVAFLLNGMANGLPATLFLLFVAHVLEAEAQAGPLLALYFIAGVAAVPVWLRISYRIGKHRTWCASMLLACAVFVWVPFLGPGDVTAFLVICALSGLSLGADLALPASMQADVVDLDRRETGRQRTGLFFAFWSMATKLSLALAVGLAFPALEVAGFRTDGVNTPNALLALACLYGLVPVLIKLVATSLVWNFEIDRSRQTSLVAT
jgi:Na+/melibiose symporter-like transporter